MGSPSNSCHSPFKRVFMLKNGCAVGFTCAELRLDWRCVMSGVLAETLQRSVLCWWGWLWEQAVRRDADAEREHWSEIRQISSNPCCEGLSRQKWDVMDCVWMTHWGRCCSEEWPRSDSEPETKEWASSTSPRYDSPTGSGVNCGLTQERLLAFTQTYSTRIQQVTPQRTSGTWSSHVTEGLTNQSVL